MLPEPVSGDVTVKLRLIDSAAAAELYAVSQTSPLAVDTVESGKQTYRYPYHDCHYTDFTTTTIAVQLQ